MSDDLVLSICILVRNQVKDVERLLNSIVPQLKDGVEIVIRDGSTNDETKNFVREYSEYKQIRYIYRPKEDFDEKIISITQDARGRFVWWMGDDDIADGGVEAVLNVINKVQDVTFIWANYVLINTNKFGMNLLNDRLFESRDEILIKGGIAIGFISSTIFRRDLALTGIRDAERYLGSSFMGLYLVLHVLSQPGKYFYIHGPVVVCYPASNDEIKAVVVKAGGIIKNEAFEVFGVNFSNIVGNFSTAFSRSTIRLTIKRSFAQTWRGVLVGWVGGWDTPKGKRLRMIKYFWMFPECWIAFVLFISPLPVNKLLYGLYKALRLKREL